MDPTGISEGWVLVLVGAVLLAGFAAHELGRRLHVPRVTLLILLGVLCGPYGLDAVPSSIANLFSYVAHFALAMIGFLLGENFIGKQLKRLGASIILMPLTYVLTTAALVFFATYAVTRSVSVAILLAGIAPASAPAATVDVVRETRAKGPLAKTLLRVVAIDDALGIILFSLFLALAEGIVGHQTPMAELGLGLWEVSGAVVLGVCLGLPMAWLTGRLRPGEPAIFEAAGFVFLCGGLAAILHVSYLLACMVLGAVVANRGRHHTRPFHAIEGASEPFLAIFFVLAGFRLEVDALTSVGVVGVVYIAARSVGLIAGGRAGATITSAPDVVRKHLGWCLLPQAGIALGMAILAADRVPEIGLRLLPLVIASTVVFEVIGPSLTQRHLRLAGESSE